MTRNIAPHQVTTPEQIQAHVDELLAFHRAAFGDAVMTTPVPPPAPADPTGTPPPAAPPATGEPVPPPAPTGTDPSAPPAPPADPLAAALAEAEKWKAFSRKHETDAKTNAAAAKRLQEFEDANKTELERATARADAAEAALQEKSTATTRLEIALRHGIPDGDLDLLGSGTAEEIEARAVRIAAKNAGTPAPPPVPPVAFDGGTRVPPTPGDLKSQIVAAEKAGDKAETQRLKAQLLNQARDKQRA